MQKYCSAFLAVLLSGAAIATIPTAPALAQTCNCAGAAIRAEAPPPPLPVYEQPPLPAPGYLWTPGYWAWNNFDYYWVPGTWVEPPRPNFLWTPAYWGFNNGIYIFNAGYWGPHVGFYGGIPYGFGYGGIGYEGGYWQGGAFFYNRAVNRFGAVPAVNVYNKTVIVNNTTINNISYNGGPNGTAARPSAEEQVAANEQHVQPTAVQAQHVRAASTNTSLFLANNHGAPAIAATAHPAVFHGAGVVPAKAGGSNAAAPAAPAKPVTNALPQPAAPKAPAADTAAPKAPAAAVTAAPKAPAAVNAAPKAAAPIAPKVQSPVRAAPPPQQFAPVHPRFAPPVRRPPPNRLCGAPGFPPCPR